MAENNRIDEESPQINSAETSAKKPYVKPDFQFEHVFETNALSCGKVNNSEGSCHFNRKLS